MNRIDSGFTGQLKAKSLGLVNPEKNPVNPV
jgi:hypothetical protein